MPFISKVGNLKIEDDVSEYKLQYNSDKKIMENVWVQKDFEEDLILTDIGKFTWNPADKIYDEMVYDGDPDSGGNFWKGDWWYRIMTNRFEDDISYWRFYRKFRSQLTGEIQKRAKDFSQTVFYVPDLKDFQIQKYGRHANFHFPLWFLDMIIADGVMESGLRLNKIGIKPPIPYVAKEEYEEMLEVYKQRKQEEEPQSPILQDIKAAYADLKKEVSDQPKKIGNKRHHIEKRAAKEIAQNQFAAEKTISENQELINTLAGSLKPAEA